MTTNESSLETILGELERITAQLEAGDKPLEEALRLFEQGVILAREGQKRLDQAEQKIELLLNPGTDEERAAPLPAMNART